MCVRFLWEDSYVRFLWGRRVGTATPPALWWFEPPGGKRARCWHGGVQAAWHDIRAVSQSGRSILCKIPTPLFDRRVKRAGPNSGAGTLGIFACIKPSLEDWFSRFYIGRTSYCLSSDGRMDAPYSSPCGRECLVCIKQQDCAWCGCAAQHWDGRAAHEHGDRWMPKWDGRLLQEGAQNGNALVREQSFVEPDRQLWRVGTCRSSTERPRQQQRWISSN